jgi:hypothetical protein
MFLSPKHKAELTTFIKVLDPVVLLWLITVIKRVIRTVEQLTVRA